MQPYSSMNLPLRLFLRRAYTPSKNQNFRLPSAWQQHYFLPTFMSNIPSVQPSNSDD